MPILRRRDLVCQEAIELLTEYLEGALSRRQRRRLRAHLEACPIALPTLSRSESPFVSAEPSNPRTSPPKRKTSSPSSTAAGSQGNSWPKEGSGLH